MAHRVAWEIKNGPIPAGAQVLHKCDTPACIEVSHLFLGNHQINMRDMAKKFRASKKLTPSIVRKIRKEKGSQYRVANKYGVSQATVWDIRSGRTWGHLS